MGEFLITDIQQSPTFIDILGNSNKNDTSGHQEVTTLFSLTTRPPHASDVQPPTTSMDNEAQRILLSLTSTPKPTTEELNSFYFYKVRKIFSLTILHVLFIIE